MKSAINEGVVANSQELEYTIEAVLRDEHGRVKQVETVHNTVTTPGKAAIADQLLASPTLGKPTHMGIGTGTGGSTGLTTEIDRNALTSKARSAAVITMIADWAAGGGTGAITEAGVFDAATTGNMHLYSSFAAINKAAADTLQITWTLTIS